MKTNNYYGWMIKLVAAIGNKYGVTLNAEVTEENGDYFFIFRPADCFLCDLESLVSSDEMQLAGWEWDANSKEFYRNDLSKDAEELDRDEYFAGNPYGYFTEIIDDLETLEDVRQDFLANGLDWLI